MPRYLLDSNIISEPARPQPSSHVRTKCEAHAHESVLASVVWYELIYGLERMPGGERRDFLEDYLTEVVRPALPILPFGEAAGYWFARERVRLERIGQEPSLADGMIAATAAANDLILVTRNTSDFERFDGLHVENWFDEE